MEGETICFFNFSKSDLPKLNEAIRATAAEREETDLNILKKCTEELTNLREQADEERRARVDDGAQEIERHREPDEPACEGR